MQLLGKGQLIWLSFLISQFKVLNLLSALINNRPQESNKITISIKSLYFIDNCYRPLLYACQSEIMSRSVHMCACMRACVCARVCPPIPASPARGLQACPTISCFAYVGSRTQAKNFTNGAISPAQKSYLPLASGSHYAMGRRQARISWGGAYSIMLREMHTAGLYKLLKRLTCNRNKMQTG